MRVRRPEPTPTTETVEKVVTSTDVNQLPWPSDDCNAIPLIDPVSVNVQGNTVLFARRDAAVVDTLFYNIRLAGADLGTVGEWLGWRPLAMAEPSQSTTPTTASADPQPQLRVGGMTLVTVGPAGTGFTPADAAFRVVTDGTTVSCVRQTTTGSLYVDRFVLVEQPLQQAQARDDATPTYLLERVWETRYRRSGVRDIPTGTTDALGSKNMVNEPFYEPTVELPIFAGAAPGQYDVALVPTGTGGWRWHLAAVVGGVIDCVSYPQDDQGRVDISPWTATSFTVAPSVRLPSGTAALSVSGGLALSTFEEQETAALSDGTDATLRRSARLMLVAHVSNTTVGLSGATAVVDFAVQAGGTVPSFPTGLPCVLLDGTWHNGMFQPVANPAGYVVAADAVQVVDSVTICAVLLGQTQPSGPPVLLDGADGLVHCYFAGGRLGPLPAFLVAQFDPTVTRAIAQLPWTASSAVSGALPLVAMRAGSTFNGLAVTVADSPQGLDRCTVTINYGTQAGLPSETWQGVPRDVDSLVAVLNGSSGNDPADPAVRSGAIPFYDVTGTLVMARLAVTGASGPGGLTLVSHRADVTLRTATVAVADGVGTLTVTYALPTGATVTQTWPSLPVDLPTLTPILFGTASSAVYPYHGGTGDSSIYPLAVGSGAMLMFAKSSSPALTITVGPAASGDATRCDVTVTPKDGIPIQLAGIGRDQDSVVAALTGSAGVAALLEHVSPDPVGGLVGDQTQAAPIDLRAGSTLFDVVATAVDGTVTAGTSTATAGQGRTLSANPPAGTVPGRGMIALRAGLPSAPLLGETALVTNATSTLAATGGNGRWLAAHVPQALDFGGQGTATAPHPGSQLAPGRHLTVEAWANPRNGNPNRVIHYNGGQGALGTVTPTYFLGTQGMPTLQFGPYPSKGNFDSSFVLLPADPAFSPDKAFTWEAWVRPDSLPPAGTLCCVVQAQDQTLPTMAVTEMGYDSTGTLVFGYRGGTLANPTVATVNSGQALTLGTWTHVAVTGTAAAVCLYLDGELVKQVANPGFCPPADAPFGCVGASDYHNVSLFGAVGEVRYWRSARSAVELRRTMNSSLQGNEPNLFGYWTLDDDLSTLTIANRSAAGSALNGRLTVKPAQAATSSSDGEFLNIIAGVGGGLPVLARAFMRANHWNHLAMVHQATGGALFNRDGVNGTTIDYAAFRDTQGLAMDAQATVEAWVQLPAATALDQTILAQWGSGTADQAFLFGIDPAGVPFLAVTVADDAGTPTSYRASHSKVVTDARAHHLAATFQTTFVPAANEDEQPSVIVTITLYVDGVAAPNKRTFANTNSVSVITSGAPMSVGASALATPRSPVVAIESQAPFVGLLTGVRFWSVALTKVQISQAMAAQGGGDGADGVVSAWWFDEGVGRVAADSVADNDIVFSSTDLWAAFAPLSTVACYSNGIPIGLTGSTTSDQDTGYPVGVAQCTLGAYVGTAGIQNAMVGTLAEVRVWSAVRSRIQLLDTMYRPLTGAELDLAAYWPLDGTCADATGRGSDATTTGTTFVPSLAPVANEGPEVRNLYNGPTTEFQEPLVGRPGAIEYAESDVLSDGTPTAVMRRAYFLRNPNLATFTGYGLGELVLSYIGQVQTKPMLVGFIEGAPPVPSENLSRPLYNSALGYNSYMDATSVRLDLASTTSMTFLSSDYKAGLKMSLDTKGGPSVMWSTTVNPPGFGFQLTSGKVKGGAHLKSDLTRATQTDETYASAWTRTTIDALGLRGVWEAPPDFLNRDVGRRYQPVNRGYALVESLTADLYAMRLRGTGAMVGKIVIPDLDIPPDRNILMFAIRPDYVKNGTLDGKIGLANDPHYPLADVERGSYFKPREAYRLADEIARADQRLQTAFDQFDAQRRGQDGPAAPDLDDVKSAQFLNLTADIPVRGIANRYVWTATGGLHTETESFSSTHEHVYTGSYDCTGTAGIMGEFEAVAAAAGYFAGIDLLFGGQAKIQLQKKETDTRTVTLAVTNLCDPALQAYDPTANGGAGGYTEAAAPGKVDAYRFMSFYLPPSAENFTDFFDTVVDDAWLRFSSEPDAVALRSVQSQANGVWRVLHRVTYVSRVAPSFDTNPAQTVAPRPGLTIDTADNALLIGLVQQAMGQKPPTGANIGAAVTAVLAPTDGISPALLSSVVGWWADFLDRARGEKDPAATALLQQLLANVFRYFRAGYTGGTLPLPPG